MKIGKGLIALSAFLILVGSCYITEAAERPMSYGVSGGIGFNKLFENIGGYYGMNVFTRIDSIKNLWARTSITKIDAFGAGVKVSGTTVLKFPLIKNLDIGIVGGAGYDFEQKEVEGLYGFEFEWCLMYDVEGYEKFNITPSFNVIEIDGINYSTVHLFLNFIP